MGIISILLGVAEYTINLPFPNEMMALVNALPPDWVSLSTSLLLPMVLIVAGVCLTLDVLRARYVLAVVFTWLFVIFIWGTTESIAQDLEIGFSFKTTISNTITWGLIGGAAFYALLFWIAAFVINGKSQSNKSFNTDASKADAG